MVIATFKSNQSLPTGEYVAELVDAKDATGKFGEQIEWQFVILGPEKYSGSRFTVWTGKAGGSKSKFGRLVSALRYGETVKDGIVNTDSLIGCHLRLVVVEKTKADGGVFSSAEDFLPVEKPKAKTDIYDPFAE